MAAPESTKFQVNFKSPDGTLINLYAVSKEELEALLTAAPVASAPSADGGNICKHGAMTYREGVGAKGPWKGYMCAAPKGATDKCQTIWVR